MYEALSYCEQELQKRLHAQRSAAAEIEAEGKELHKFWRREYLEEEMVVGGAVAEIEAEDRARSHLSGLFFPFVFFFFLLKQKKSFFLFLFRALRGGCAHDPLPLSWETRTFFREIGRAHV